MRLLSAPLVLAALQCVVHPSPRSTVSLCDARSDARYAARYRVYLYNDSFNMREYVQRVLMMVSDVSEEEALSIMTQADWGFRAAVGTWEKPIAEHIYEGMTSAGLQAALEPEEPSEPEVPDGREEEEPEAT